MTSVVDRHWEKRFISTHTLTWSVTRKQEESEETSENFNSHAHVERDGGEIQLRDQDGNFNSHAHVERDAYELLFVSCL